MPAWLLVGVAVCWVGCSWAGPCPGVVVAFAEQEHTVAVALFEAEPVGHGSAFLYLQALTPLWGALLRLAALFADCGIVHWIVAVGNLAMYRCAEACSLADFPVVVLAG